MDQSTINLLAAAVTSQLTSQFLLWTIAQAAVASICAGFAAYAGGYLRRRGENLATKQDFVALAMQLEANTRLVETVKADVGIQDWSRRQRLQLRLTKLEALMALIHSLDEELDAKRRKAIEAQPYEGPEYLERINGLTVLYFPELSEPARLVSIAALSFAQSCLGLASALIDARGDPEACRVARDNFTGTYTELYKGVRESIADLQREARNSLDKTLVDAEGGPRP